MSTVDLLMPKHNVPNEVVNDGRNSPIHCRSDRVAGYVHIQDDGRWHCNRCGWVTPEPQALPPAHRTTWVRYTVQGSDEVCSREFFTDLVAMGPEHVKWLLSNVLLTPIDQIALLP